MARGKRPWTTQAGANAPDPWEADGFGAGGGDHRDAGTLERRTVDDDLSGDDLFRYPLEWNRSWRASHRGSGVSDKVETPSPLLGSISHNVVTARRFRSSAAGGRGRPPLPGCAGEQLAERGRQLRFETAEEMIGAGDRAH